MCAHACRCVRDAHSHLLPSSRCHGLQSPEQNCAAKHSLGVEITASDSGKKEIRNRKWGNHDKEQNINVSRRPDCGQESRAARRERLFINLAFTRHAGLNRDDEKRTNTHVQSKAASPPSRTLDGGLPRGKINSLVKS